MSDAAGKPAVAAATVAIHPASASAVYQFCLALIRDLQAAGFRVVALCKYDSFFPLLQERGISVRRTHSGGRSIDPVSILRYLLGVWRILRQERPALIHLMSPKAIFFVTLLARLSGIKTVCVFTGLGYLFTRPRYHPSRMAATIGFRIVLRAANRVVFLNHDDIAYFIRARIVQRQKSRLIRSSGVDIHRYERAEPISYPAVPTFVFIGRLMLIKGVERFLSAAHAVCAAGRNAHFIVVGDNEPARSGMISDARLAYYQRELGTALECVGQTHDVRPYLQTSSVLVLPTRYREGTPQSILEAMACRLAIITTDVPGCRETVIDGKNGFLISPNDQAALVERMTRIVDEPARIPLMGEESYNAVCANFSADRVDAETIALYRSLGVGTAGAAD